MKITTPSTILKTFACIFLIGLFSIAQAQIVGDNEVCIDETRTYTSSLSGTIVWTVTPTSPTLYPSGMSLLLTWNVTPGTYTITADNGSSTEMFFVDVYATPAPIIQYIKNDCSTHEPLGGEGGVDGIVCDTFCINEQVTYWVDDNVNNTYLWTVTNGNIIGSNTGPSVVVVWDAVPVVGEDPCGKVIVTETNIAGCSGTDVAYGVANYPNGIISISPSMTSVCLNQPATFNVSYSGGPFLTFTWDFGNGVVVTNTTGSVSYTYPAPGTYTVLLTATTECCSTTDTAIVVVDSLAGPNIYCITPVCANTAGVEYCTDAVCSTYNWDVDGEISYTVSGGGTCITVDWGPGPIGSISLSVGGCTPDLCSDTTVVTVPIMPDGNFNIVGPNIVCVGSTFPYEAPNVPGSQYTWTLIPPSTVPSVLPYHTPPYIQDINFPVSGTYTLICYMENDLLDCSGADTIVINTLPNLSIGGPSQLCDGTPGNYTSNYSADWTVNPGAIYIGTGTNVSYIFPGPGVYSVVATSTLVCDSPDSISVVVNAYPSPPVINGPLTVCPGGTYTYTTSGYPPGVFYNWIFTSASGSSFGSSNVFNLTLPAAFVSGTLTLYVTENGCQSSSVINLTAPSTPTPVIDLIGLGNVCPDATVTYSAFLSYPGLSNVDWSLSPPSAGTIMPGLLPGTVDILWHANTTNTTQTVTLTVTETICLTSTGTDSYTFDIYPKPIITASGGSFCPGSSFTLTATGGVSYQWYNSSSIPVSASVSTQGNYYVIGTDGNGCTNIDYTDVIALPEPVAFISTPEKVICDLAGNMLNTINLTAVDNGYTFFWSTGSITNPTPVSATGTYTVTVTDGNGCTNTDSYDVMCPDTIPDTCDVAITPLCGCDLFPPTYTQGSVQCNNFTFNMNSTCLGGVFNWNFGDGFGGTGSSVTHDYTAAGYYTVSYSYYDPLCCPPLPADTFVFVPVAALFSHEVVCNTLTVLDNSSFLPPYNITTWEWNFGDGTPVATGNNPAPHNYALPGTYTVSLTVYTASGCEATYTELITINGPAISAGITASACNGPVAFTATDLGSSIIIWDWNFGDGFTSNLQNTEHTYAVPATYTVTLTGTDASGCMATSTGSVTVVAPPASFALTYTSPSCGPATITIPGAALYTSFQWYNNGTLMPGETGSSLLAIISGNYTVEVVDANGCIISSLPANVIINPQPAITFNLPALICFSSDLVIQSNVSGPYTYTWDIDGSGYFAAANLNLPGGSLTVGPHTVTLTVTDPVSGCSDTQSMPFDVEASPSVYITSSDPGGICSGATIMLTAISPTAVLYDWSNNGILDHIFVQGAGSYDVLVTDALGCTASASINTVVFPLPDLSMLPIGCDSSCIAPTPEIIHGPPGMLSYNWQINGVTAATSQDLTLNTSNLPVFGIPYTIQLIATTINGCVDSSSFEYIPLECETECFVLTDTIYCNFDGTYTIELQVTNLGAATSTYLWLHDVNLPFTLTPSFVVPLTLTTGATSAPIPITVSYPIGSTLPTDVCFLASLYNADTCCHDTTLYCIPLPPCDPCDDVSASLDTLADCCADISIENNYSSIFFSGIEVKPISFGVSIATAALDAAYLATWTGYGTSTAMYFQPSSGLIPTGTYNDLIELCLNVAIGAPSTQLVEVNWLYTNADGTVSVACSDTLYFECETPVYNPCGSIEGVVTCQADGTYIYDFTFTNNSMNDVTMLVFTSVTPVVNITPNPILLPYALSFGDSYTSSVVIDPGAILPGTDICFDLTLADSTGWCCHELDSVCITLPVCDICACGSWEDFLLNVQPPADLGYGASVNCGDNLTAIPAGTNIDFVGGGYLCDGDAASCLADITWTLTGPISLDASGMPSFTLTFPGTYTLSIIGYCNGSACDTCVITFQVVEELCGCGDWGLFTISSPTKSWINRACGSSLNWRTGDMVTIDGAYNCSGDCDATYSYTIKRNNIPYASGFGIPINFTPTLAGNYQVQIYPNCGGMKCSACVLRFKVKDPPSPLRAASSEASSVTLIPNPANDKVTVIIESGIEEDGRLQILNELGVSLYIEIVRLEKGSNAIELSLSTLTSGVYWVRYASPQTILIDRLVVVH